MCDVTIITGFRMCEIDSSIFIKISPRASIVQSIYNILLIKKKMLHVQYIVYSIHICICGTFHKIKLTDDALETTPEFTLQFTYLFDYTMYIGVN